MREILFRGIDCRYSKENKYFKNVFRVGNLINYDNGDVGISSMAHHYGLNNLTSGVIPETVGQYTGLKDNYGRKIFEGDIVEVLEITKEGEHVYTSSVNYAEYGFFVSDDTESDTPLNIVDDPLYPVVISRVIGNIHDNPEVVLVKEEE